LELGKQEVKQPFAPTDNWQIIWFRPGKNPIESLAVALMGSFVAPSASKVIFPQFGEYSRVYSLQIR
jgi:hypothetical protein